MPKFHSDFLETLSVRVTDATSGSLGFAFALLIVFAWLIAGPILNFSEPWQLFINTVTTTVTFLMVFLIQRAEKKDAQALHIKLNHVLDKLGVDERILDLENRREQDIDKHEEDARKAAEAARHSSSPN